MPAPRKEVWLHTSVAMPEALLHHPGVASGSARTHAGQGLGKVFGVHAY
jgi:hypothetical protein